MDDWSYTSPEDDVPKDLYAASDAARADQTWRQAEARRGNLAHAAATHQREAELDQAPSWETVDATTFDDCAPPGSRDTPGIPVTF